MCENVKNGLSREEIQTKVQEIFNVREEKKQSGKSYNIFRVIRAEHKEPDMTEILADFLNPDGFHQQGRAFLDIFMNNVLKITEMTENVTVYSQYQTRCKECPGKFIDIVIKIGDEKIIPIEAKIYAPVGIGQLENYYIEALSYQKDKDVKPDVYYLTLGGQKAEDRGLGEQTKKAREHIKSISWEKDIAGWLGKCQEYCTKNNVHVVPEIMRQFQEDITRWIGKKTEIEELDEIFCDKPSKEYALEIWNNSSEENQPSWENIVKEYVEEKRKHVRQTFLNIIDVKMKTLGAEIDDHAETYSRYLFRMEETAYWIVIYLEPYWHKTKITASVFSESKNNKLQFIKPEEYPVDLLKQPLPASRDLKFGEFILQEHVFAIEKYVQECERVLKEVYETIKPNIL